MTAINLINKPPETPIIPERNYTASDLLSILRRIEEQLFPITESYKPSGLFHCAQCKEDAQKITISIFSDYDITTDKTK